MWEYNHSDELYHYGRKGMKWGQHIYAKPTNTRSKRKNSLREKTEQQASRYVKGRDYVNSLVSRDLRITARDVTALASAALWVAAEFSPVGAAGLGAAAAITNMSSWFIDPD